MLQNVSDGTVPGVVIVVMVATVHATTGEWRVVCVGGGGVFLFTRGARAVTNRVRQA